MNNDNRYSIAMSLAIISQFTATDSSILMQMQSHNCKCDMVRHNFTYTYLEYEGRVVTIIQPQGIKRWSSSTNKPSREEKNQFLQRDEPNQIKQCEDKTKGEIFDSPKK
jgi:hypothetical protein